MYITSPDPPKREVTEYDFSFQNGMMLPVTIDKDGGDTIDLETYPHAIIINFAPKPSLVNPEVVTPPEQITIFTSHLLSIHKRVREVTDPTQEQKDLMKLTFQEMGKSVN